MFPSKAFSMLSISSLVAISLQSSAFAETALHDSAEEFLARGRAIVASAEAGTLDAGEVVTKVTEMLEFAKPVVTFFGTSHSQCAQQLTRVLELYPQINTWTPTQIRTNIERAAALPPANGCYPARDIVAHPAIVRALARVNVASNLTRIKNEMAEALEHMEEIAREFPNE